MRLVRSCPRIAWNLKGKMVASARMKHMMMVTRMATENSDAATWTVFPTKSKMASGLRRPLVRYSSSGRPFDANQLAERSIRSSSAAG